MDKKNNNRICSAKHAGGLDNSIRKALQNPHKILSPFIKDGMTVLDVGCGSGVFTIEIAKLLSGSGKVIAADRQEEMLEIVRRKIKESQLDERIELHKCSDNNIGVNEKVDFILAFYMVHEVPSQDKLFNEMRSILKADGKILIVEPKFHVTKKAFSYMLQILNNKGFEIIDGPKVFFSRSVLLTIKN